MIGLDTNIVVRFLVDDDPAQCAAARALFARLTETEPGFVARETAVEIHWVLSRACGLPRAEVCDALEGLALSAEIAMEAADDVLAAIAAARAGAGDFADLMIATAGRRAGCAETVTFDRRAARAEGMRLLETGGA